MKIDFDKIIDRTHTSSLKWSYLDIMYGTKDITSMWVADSDFKVPQLVIDKLVTRAEHGLFGYTAKPEVFFESFINWVDKRHDWQIEKDWMISTPGIVPAITWAVNAFTSPGDKIIIQPPVYYPFFSSVTDNKRVLVENSLINSDGKYTMDFEGLLNVIDDKTKMLILCNPHNPIGRVWKKEELILLGDICLKKGIIIVSDEIHSDLIYSGHKHIPIASISESLSQVTMTCMAPSKTFNVAGLEASVTVIKNSELRDQFKEFQKSIGMNMMNIFGIEGFTACYTDGEQWLEEQLLYLNHNIQYFSNFMKNELPEFKVTPVEGTYLLWLDCSVLKMNLSELKAFFINKVKVGLDDGEMFGKTGEHFMRFNLATPKANIIKVLNQFKGAYEDFKNDVI